MLSEVEFWESSNQGASFIPTPKLLQLLWQLEVAQLGKLEKSWPKQKWDECLEPVAAISRGICTFFLCRWLSLPCFLLVFFLKQCDNALGTALTAGWTFWDEDRFFQNSRSSRVISPGLRRA